MVNSDERKYYLVPTYSNSPQCELVPRYGNGVLEIAFRLLEMFPCHTNEPLLPNPPNSEQLTMISGTFCFRILNRL